MSECLGKSAKGKPAGYLKNLDAGSQSSSRQCVAPTAKLARCKNNVFSNATLRARPLPAFVGVLYESCGGTGLAQVKLKLKFTLKLVLQLFMPRVSLPALCAWLEEHVPRATRVMCWLLAHASHADRTAAPAIELVPDAATSATLASSSLAAQLVFAVRNALRHLRHRRSRAMDTYCDTSWRRRVCAV